VTQLTVRGFEPRLERALKELAEREGISLSQAAVKLMRRGAGIERATRIERATPADESLDWLCGRWSDDEARAFDEAVSVFEAVDQEHWR
jgi:hypothetical protein